MRNISCGCSSGIAEIFSSVTVAAGKRLPKSTTIATKTVLGNLIMCNLPPDSQQALAIFEDDLLSRLLGRSPWFSCSSPHSYHKFATGCSYARSVSEHL